MLNDNYVSPFISSGYWEGKNRRTIWKSLESFFLNHWGMSVDLKKGTYKQSFSIFPEFKESFDNQIYQAGDVVEDDGTSGRICYTLVLMYTLKHTRGFESVLSNIINTWVDYDYDKEFYLSHEEEIEKEIYSNAKLKNLVLSNNKFWDMAREYVNICLAIEQAIRDFKKGFDLFDAMPSWENQQIQETISRDQWGSGYDN